MPIRVLIVDDSPFIREVLREGLAAYPDIDIVGEAGDGKRAEQLVCELRPDVVTMDVVMPMVGGMEAIERIMARCPTPIVVVSDAQSNIERLALQAVEAGAIDVFSKPDDGFDEASAADLVRLIRAASHVRVRNRRLRSEPELYRPAATRSRLSAVRFIGVVASTGGPQTLQRLLRNVGKAVSVPVAIVQHTATGFTPSLVEWLAATTGLRVSIAQRGGRARPGAILVAPCDRHLEIRKGGVVDLHSGPKLASHRPSGTVLLRSLADAFGPAAAGVVLTGMGDDGAAGLRAIEDRGGLALVEDPATAILAGMPRAAIEATTSPIVASAGEIGRLLSNASAGE